MNEVRYFSRTPMPLEMHKVCIVQKTNLPPVERRVEAIREAGFNSYRLFSEDVYLDMLTDSGVNAMTNEQLGAMMVADEAYAGTMTYKKLSAKLTEIFGKTYFLPAHQGRACEHILAKTFVREGDLVPMNFMFGTAVAQISLMGGSFVSLLDDKGLQKQSDEPFKGDFDERKLISILDSEAERIAYVRIEAGTNLIGGQPISMRSMLRAAELCRERGIMSVLDASLLQDNLHFIKTREHPELTIREITRRIADAMDIIYFSARKFGFGRGGVIITDDEAHYLDMKAYVSRYEGFPTYGGMSIREMEAIAVGLDDTMDEVTISQGPAFISYLCAELSKNGVDVVTPPGGLGCHVDARKFVPHIPLAQYPAGSLAAAIYIASGARGMERGGIDEPWEDPNVEPFGAMELVRLAMPRRVYTVSQLNYLIDRLIWLKQNAHIIGGLRFPEGSKRHFYDALESIGDWPQALAAKFREDFRDSL
ncbi:MAG: tryptophanase [Clostridia bacterium]|nr:tryptophanase [Clostridia bacterium]